MAGRLEFAAGAAWGPAPRARFGSLYRLSEGAPMSPDILKDIDWLLNLMATIPPSITEPLTVPRRPPVLLYTDASGAPHNGLGAFLVDGDKILYTSCTAPQSLL
eukprot:936621-Heterocapsa_arctica.AAC.1